MQEVQSRIARGELSVAISCLSLYETTNPMPGTIEGVAAKAPEDELPHVCRSRTGRGAPISGGCECSWLFTGRADSSSGLGYFTS